MNMVWHEVTFHYPTLFLHGQFSENLPKMLVELAIYQLLPIFWNPNQVVLAIPCCMT
jgi:hypothetical protein